MSRPRCVNCIIPPHILKKLLDSDNKKIRDAAFKTLLSTTRFRAERTMIAGAAWFANVANQKRRTIYDCRHSSVTQHAKQVRTEGHKAVSDGTVNAAYEGLGTTYDFYDKVLQRTSIDGKGMRLDGYVHYGQMYNNAFWNGRQMVFGDGDHELFLDFTRSLDVIGHELTHGVTDFTAGLEYHNQSGALNESVSDVFGSLVKQWSLSQTAEQADWLIGADIFTPSIKADALRSLKNPGTAYDNEVFGRDPQPGHMDDYVQMEDTEDDDWGGVHINSGIPNHAFYLLATQIGGHAWEAPGHIWYEALKAAQPTTNFEEFAVLTHEIAGRLYGTNSAQQRAVFDSWEEVGIELAPAESPCAEQATSRDSQAALKRKLEGLKRDVEALTGRMTEFAGGKREARATTVKTKGRKKK
jgi:Zn-dependent metalloprotease